MELIRKVTFCFSVGVPVIDGAILNRAREVENDMVGEERVSVVLCVIFGFVFYFVQMADRNRKEIISYGLCE